jgi:hypothetical protein
MKIRNPLFIVIIPVLFSSYSNAQDKDVNDYLSVDFLQKKPHTTRDTFSCYVDKLQDLYKHSMALNAAGDERPDDYMRCYNAAGNKWYNPLRKAIVLMAQRMDAVPQVPEDSRIKTVAAGILLLNLPDEHNAFKKRQNIYTSVSYMFEANILAPWSADTYYSLALADEMDENYYGAKINFKYFLLTNPPYEDARKAQNEIDFLEQQPRK